MKNKLKSQGENLLNKQLNKLGPFDFAKSLAKGQSMSRYRFAIDGLNIPLSVLEVSGHEQLNQAWQYVVRFTCTRHYLSVEQILNNHSILILAPPDADVAIGNVAKGLLGGLEAALPEQLSSSVQKIGSMAGIKGLDKLAKLRGLGQNRILYGMVTAFSQLSSSSDETVYEVVFSSRLALLDNTVNNAIYQQQTIPQIVEQVLRRHDFSGIDFRFELKEHYPKREFVTQWQESDLTFIRRILADVGIWFRFETHSKHNCDTLVFGDNEQPYQQGLSAPLRSPSGLSDNGALSVWDLTVTRKVVPKSVQVQDYNYRDASAPMMIEVNSQHSDRTTHGRHYYYGENYRERGEEQSTNAKLADSPPIKAPDIFSPESEKNNGDGVWLARIRHQRLITEQITLTGKTTLNELAPGQVLQIPGAGINEAKNGVLIVSIETTGSRESAYEISFTAIPYNALKPYRPELLTWPSISGTLTARVTSPDNDTYGYIDTQGRYRVKFNYDLSIWKKGDESLWLRLAKAYSGDTYGMHFPLIDGTEVAIAFTDGNPDRPYIAHAMHDSVHPDLVTTENKQRNVIRTPANNKLRMEDKRGQEHIKVATEYGKTQLNLGHLVDKEREQRGEGFELRTDEWGAIRAGKGLYISSEKQPKSQGNTLDMDNAISQLKQALEIANALQNAAQSSNAHPSDTASQEILQQALDSLTQAGIIQYAPSGIALTSPSNIQLSTDDTVSITASNQTDISALKKITLAAGDAISLFAQKLGLKLFAAKGKVEIQAQSDGMDIAAKQDINISSVDGLIQMGGAEEVLFCCGGSYIKISGSGIELGTGKNVTLKCAAMQKMGGAELFIPLPDLKPGELNLPIEQIQLNIQLSDIPGLSGLAYGNTQWRIVKATSQSAALMTNQVMLTGVTNPEGELVLQPEESTLILKEYNRQPGGLWLVHTSLAYQIQFNQINPAWGKTESAMRAANAMGYSDNYASTSGSVGSKFIENIESESTITKQQLLTKLKK